MMQMHRFVFAILVVSACPTFLPLLGVAQDNSTGSKSAARDASQTLDTHEAIVQKLQQPIDIEFVETPFKDVIAFVAESLKLKIMIDARALGEAAVSLDVPVTKSVQDLPAHVFMGLLLKELDLAMVRREGFLQISTPAKLDAEIELRTYPIRDLPGVDDEQRDIQPALELIEKMVDPSSWKANGGRGDIVRLQTILIVRQTPLAHDQIADLLRQTRAALNEAHAAK